MGGECIKILVIEDNAANLLLLKRALEHRPDLCVIGAYTLCEGRQLLAEQTPDLLIVDHLLPDGEGLELLREFGSEMPLPVIMMTRHGDEQVAVMALNAGALDYMAKSDHTFTDMPHRIDRTMREWERIVNHRRAEAELVECRRDLEALVDARTQALEQANRELNREAARVSQHRDHLHKLVKARTQELKVTSMKLATTSYQAEKGEVATGVLHNVGNVLNSIRVSATVIKEKVAVSRVGDLERAAELLQRHASDFSSFLSENPGGNKFPLYLRKLSAHLAQEQQTILKTAAELVSHVEHIAEIVSVQQSVSRRGGMEESTSPTALMDDAIRINELAQADDEIFITREYQEMPEVTLDRSSVLQILTNLISNAKNALREGGTPDPRLRLAVRRTGSVITFQVEDNGMGISAEHMCRLFSHGFTTRKGGHGFGLHSGAEAAKAMGGSLSAGSAGCGRGATFTLELPYRSPAAKPDAQASSDPRQCAEA